MAYFILFLFGLCLGSFLNVLIYREALAENKKFRRLKSWLPSWVTGRSFCDHCQKRLVWYDNIPLLSYLLLKGKCRYCQKKIPFQYPLVEFLTGVEFVWVYFLIKSNLSFFSRFEGFYSFLSLISWLVLGACLLAIFLADWKYQIIPDTLILGGIAIVFFKIFVDYRYTGMIDFSVFWAALLASLFFSGLVLITQSKGMGMGDVKLAFLMGLVLGFPRIITALVFSFLTGAAVGVILILLGKKKLKSKIAFGPFLVAGTIFALFLNF
jgi:prepilin signal peptidase PulO-like enzyme (type II secretory pathway)